MKSLAFFPRTRRMAIIMHLFLLGYVAVILFPLSWVVIGALKTNREMFLDPTGLPADPNWGKFIEAWNAGVRDFFINSVVVSGVSVALIVIASALAAYALTRMNFRYSGWVYLLTVLCFAIPVHAVLVPIYGLLSDLHLLNTHLGLILPYAAFGLPFSIILMYSFFYEFPAELEEAGKLDGCGPWRRLWFVVLPLSRPVLISVAIFNLVGVWNEFLLATIIMTSKHMQTLPLGLVSFRDQYGTDWPGTLAAISIGSLPLLVLFVIFQKYFVRSMAGMGK
ncbi:carbohydrate ABC transporter permease [Maritimibacter fusiformis]|uniref:Carbohydrate ABC transporter permease n=1 Tax=Maritimibacter fusiformis TaxID=2603819 RepID=A0A5D0RMN4_9RHOB|nr:carbohydrate ABC transporter permease [Maritimibacter fusiformis]TYB82379.1 carbohydrate ABC transporter permease [Maritimibacter fusiformis]